MSTNYWIVAQIGYRAPSVYVPDGLNSVFDPSDVLLKMYLDEVPEDRSDLSREGTGRRVNSNAASMFLSNGSRTSRHWYCYFRVSQEQFENPNRNLYFWVEQPIGHYALRTRLNPSGGTRAHGGMYVGRLRHTPIQSGSKGVVADSMLWNRRTSAVQPRDEYELHFLEIGPSVLNYIACEINVNTRSDFTRRWNNPRTENPTLAYVTPAGDGDPENFSLGDVSNVDPAINMDVVDDTSIPVTLEDRELIRMAHTNSGKAGWAYRRAFNMLLQDGGGQWDHKPRIEPHWGNYVRVGNSGNLYYYDYFSNIHFGYVAHAMGMSEERSLTGTNIFQQIDNSGAHEDYFDRSPNLSGWHLAETKGANSSYPGQMVTSADIHQELLSHSRWESMQRSGVERIAGIAKDEWHEYE